MSFELIHYFVEGVCEESFIRSFQHSHSQLILKPGKITIFNFVQDYFSPTRARAISKGTKVVIVFDVDVKRVDILKRNVETLLHYSGVKEEDIYFIHSIQCFEDEIVYASNIKNINELFNTKGSDEFKKKFIDHKDIVHKLNSVGFSLERMWSRKEQHPFEEFKNRSSFIKSKKEHE